MKNNAGKKTILLMLSLVLFCFGLSGCGVSSSSSATSYSTDSAAYSDSYSGMMNSAVTEEAAPTGGVVEEARENVKRIYTGEVALESVKFDESLKKIESMVQEAGGYFQSNDVYTRDSWGDNDSFREANMMVRVPVEKFDALMDDLTSGDGFSTIRQSVSSDDVSEQYYDIQMRLESARSEVARLTELLEEAKDVSDVISVEQALSDATYRVESLQGQLNGMDSRIDYSTININLSEVTALTMTARAAGYGSKLMESLSNGFTGGIEFMGDLILLIAGHWLILLFVVCVIMLVVTLRKRKRNKKKRAQNIAETDEE